MKKYIICDIDGTIADCTHRKHFIEGTKKNYDAFYEACFEDTPIIPIISLLWQYVDHCSDRFKLIFVSGRRESCRGDTRQWLATYATSNYIELHLRPNGDYTPDHEFKRSLLHTKLPPKEEILFVLDDRQRVVDMWREEGLTCLQVAPGNF